MDAVFLSELLWKPVTKDGEHLSLLELLEQDRRYPQGLSNLSLEESGKELHLEVQINNLLFDSLNFLIIQGCLGLHCNLLFSIIRSEKRSYIILMPYFMRGNLIRIL